MIKENRNPHFVSICERCGEINVFPKTDKVPGYCPVCGYRSLYKVGYITSSEKVEHCRSEGQALGEILEELKKINEYIDIQKAKEVCRVNTLHLSSKNGRVQQFTYEDILEVQRRLLQDSSRVDDLRTQF